MKYSIWKRIMMVFSPRRLEQAIDEEVQKVNTEWHRVLNSTYTDRPLDSDVTPFVSLHVTKAGIWCDGKKWNRSDVMFQQRAVGAAVDFSPRIMQEFWDGATKALGAYILEHGYGQIVLSTDPMDKGVKIANVRLNVYNPEKDK